VADCLGSNSAMRNYVVQLGVASDLHNRSAMMDLMIFRSCCLIPHSMISSFVVALHGFYSKAYSKGLSLNWLWVR
jgi:hypothetical protein